MKSTPIVVFFGPAGSGKDAAAKMVKELVPKTVLLPHAAPLKMLGDRVFGFTEDQLYGPSESRNAPDLRFMKEQTWNLLRKQALTKYSGNEVVGWLKYCGIPDAIGAYDKWLNQLYVQTIASGVCLTPRLMLQTLGTEFGRAIDQDIWARIAMTKANEKLVSGEANLVLVTDGRFKNEVLNAKRHNAMAVLVKTPDVKEVTGGIKGHQSEAELGSIPEFWYDKVIVNMKQFGLDYFKNKMSEFTHEHILCH